MVFISKPGKDIKKKGGNYSPIFLMDVHPKVLNKILAS